MKKSIIIAALVLAAGFFAAKPSFAQASAGGQVVSQNGATNEGTWSVLATQVSTYVWDVSVTYVNTITVPPELATAFLDGLNVEFYSGASVNGTELATTGTIGTIASETGGVGAFNWTTNGISEGGGSAYQYLDTSGTGGQNQINGYDQGGLITQGQTFTGVVTLSSTVNAAADASINVVKFGVQNSGEVNAWFATPEGSSLALLLPGLVPVGLILRRRRRA